MNLNTEASFHQFEDRVREEILSHPIIAHNTYCDWFASEPLTLEDLRYFTIQFSVFSNQFLVAQLHKMINAVDLGQMRSAKEILANEIGCSFHNANATNRSRQNPDSPEFVGTEGTVDGGRFHFKAAHFEWLLNFAKPLGLQFQDLGKREHGSPNTLFFCDELIRIYGNQDFNRSSGASFAVENWAAAGFWKQLIQGLTHFKEEQMSALPLGFFVWHDQVEDQHKAHTHDELKELYFGPHSFDEACFLEAGCEMLEGVSVFWKGLNENRLQRHAC